MKYDLGKIGEDFACKYLKENNFKILEQNYKSKFGEIDIIAGKNNNIYFIEVKTRKNNDFGRPEEAVNKNKIIKIQKTASHFLQNNSNTVNFNNIKIMILALLVENGKLKEINKYYQEI